MREIKFRGLNRHSRKWCYGYLVVDEKYTQIWQEGDVPVSVDPETVGQYTNFWTCKNRGIDESETVDVYEKDIIEEMSRGFRAEVVFLDGAFWAEHNESMTRILLKACIDTCIVIGNIYENPELLEEKG